MVKYNMMIPFQYYKACTLYRRKDYDDFYFYRERKDRLEYYSWMNHKWVAVSLSLNELRSYYTIKFAEAKDVESQIMLEELSR